MTMSLMNDGQHRNHKKWRHLCPFYHVWMQTRRFGSKTTLVEAALTWKPYRILSVQEDPYKGGFMKLPKTKEKLEETGQVSLFIYPSLPNGLWQSVIHRFSTSSWSNTVSQAHDESNREARSTGLVPSNQREQVIFQKRIRGISETKSAAARWGSSKERHD